MSKRALLLVDVQQDFLPGGAVGSHDKGILDVICTLLQSNHFDLTVASQDWHPKVIRFCKVQAASERLAQSVAILSCARVMSVLLAPMAKSLWRQ